MTNREYEISENIKRVKERIANAAHRSGRDEKEIKLVCVTKNFGSDDINAAIRNGVTDIGENRVQEMCEKYDFVKYADWHLIGHLQTNKVKYVIDKVSLIQSVDSVHLLEEIERQASKNGIAANILLQVNTSGEESKFGASPDELYRLCERAAEMKSIKVCGIMTIAPLCVEGVSNRLHFNNTRELYIDIKKKKYDNIDMKYLSMGMSGDFEEAIECGSNMVRIGSAIFGKRISYILNI